MLGRGPSAPVAVSDGENEGAGYRYAEDRGPRSPGQGDRGRTEEPRNGRRDERPPGQGVRRGAYRHRQEGCRGRAQERLREAPSQHRDRELSRRGGGVKSAVVVFPGSNREADVARALRLAAGSKPAMVWHADNAPPARTALCGAHG